LGIWPADFRRPFLRAGIGVISASMGRQTKRVIIPLTVQEILDERIAQKLA
jgi:hypothetical protein